MHSPGPNSNAKNESTIVSPNCSNDIKITGRMENFTRPLNRATKPDVESLVSMLSEVSTYVDDLRFALEIMDEYSHLGLDSEHAAKLRSLMLEQIAKAEKALRDSRAVEVAFGPTDGNATD